MKLYQHPMSSNARRALMVARHLDLPVETVLVDLPAGEHRSPSYLAMNPMGAVPMLVDGDLRLCESHAIMMYLADQAPGQTLYPTETQPRAKVHQWLFWSAYHWTPAIGALNFENMLKAMFFGGGAPDPARVARHNESLTRLGAVLETHLTGREWLVGDTVSLADYAIAASMMTMVPAKLPLTEFAELQRWFGQVRELPAWQATEIRR